MAEEIAFKNGSIYNFQGLVTLTLDRVTLHAVVHHSLTTFQISLKLKKLYGYLKLTYVWMDIWDPLHSVDSEESTWQVTTYVGKPSAIGQQPGQLHFSSLRGQQTSSKLQLDVCYLSYW